MLVSRVEKIAGLLQRRVTTAQELCATASEVRSASCDH